MNSHLEEDLLHIAAKEDQVADSWEVDEGIRLEYDGSGEVAGVEIMNARKNMTRTLAQEISREIRASAR
jgi:uncharacterized protein YuzE